jgi:hypothetical protein
LSFFRVLEYPVNGRKVVIAYSSPGAFDVPVKPIRVFGVLEVVARVAGRIEVVQNELR